MMPLLLLTLSSICVWATSQDNMQTLLNKPVQERVREFKNLGTLGYEFLRKTSHNRELGMNLRWRAITTMGRLNPKAFRSDIESALKNADWYLRNAGLIAIRNDDRQQAVLWSTRLLSDPALIVRTQAVRNLIDLDAHEIEPLLWKMLFDKRNFRGDQSLWIRAHLAEAVAKFAGPGRAQQFRRLLEDRDERLHKWAIKGVEKVTGLSLGHVSEALEVRRQKWLSRLSGESI